MIPTRFTECYYSSLDGRGSVACSSMALWRWNAAYTFVFRRGIILGRKIFYLQWCFGGREHVGDA